MRPGGDSATALNAAQAEEPALFKLVNAAQVEPSAASTTSNGPEPDDDLPLYAARRHIYPQRVHGTYRRIKWIILYLTLGIYYLLPFVRWDRGPDAPGQAVLVDLANGRIVAGRVGLAQGHRTVQQARLGLFQRLLRLAQAAGSQRALGRPQEG